MKILIVIPQLPYPKHKNGICSTIGNMIPYWSEENTITFIYFDERDVKAETVLQKELDIECKHYDIGGKEYVYRYQGDKYIKPRNSWGYCFNNSENIDISDYDVVILSSFVSAFLISSFTNRSDKQKIIFFEADAMSLFYKRSMEKTNSFIKRVYFLSQIKAIESIENLFYHYADSTVFVSDVDQKYIVSIADKKLKDRFVNAHIGVEVKKERSDDFIAAKKHVNLCFSGIMDYQPNKDAVEYILEKIIPNLVNENIPFTFHIIGKNPHQNWFQNKYVNMGKVIVTGFIDNIDEYLANMDLYVCPLFLGTGMKNKILQAMGVGLPIICSKVSVEGINELVHSKNVLICNEEPEDWINSIKSISSNIKLMGQFSKLNKEIIKKEYTWEQTANKVLSIKYGGTQ